MHCYEHNDVVSPEMHGVNGHVIACDVGPRYQRRKKTSQKTPLKEARLAKEDERDVGQPHI